MLFKLSPFQSQCVREMRIGWRYHSIPLYNTLVISTQAINPGSQQQSTAEAHKLAKLNIEPKLQVN